MKKLLFATTALIATAGMASAEIKFSGLGRFGIGHVEDRDQSELKGSLDFDENTYEITLDDPTLGHNRVHNLFVGKLERGDFKTFNNAVANGDIDLEDVSEIEYVLADAAEKTDISDTILISRFRLNIDGSAQTDNGVDFSARVRLEANEDDKTGDANTADLNGARFSVIYGGLRVDAGNVDGAIGNLKNRPGNEPGMENFVGQSSGMNYSRLGYSSGGTGENGVFFEYQIGDLGIAASYDQNATITVSERIAVGNAVATASTKINNVDRWDMSVTYAFNNVIAAIAYGQNDISESLTLLTLGAEFGDFSGTLFVADDDVVSDTLSGTAYGFSAKYAISGATTLNFAYGNGSAESDEQKFGIGAIHDLGGGASLRGGIGQTKIGDGDGRLRADFGANFNF